MYKCNIDNTLLIALAATPMDGVGETEEIEFYPAKVMLLLQSNMYEFMNIADATTCGRCFW